MDQKNQDHLLWNPMEQYQELLPLKMTSEMHKPAVIVDRAGRLIEAPRLIDCRLAEMTENAYYRLHIYRQDTFWYLSDKFGMDMPDFGSDANPLKPRWTPMERMVRQFFQNYEGTSLIGLVPKNTAILQDNTPYFQLDQIRRTLIAGLAILVPKLSVRIVSPDAYYVVHHGRMGTEWAYAVYSAHVVNKHFNHNPFWDLSGLNDIDPVKVCYAPIEGAAEYEALRYIHAGGGMILPLPSDS